MMDIIIKYIELEKGAQNEMVHIKRGEKSPLEFSTECIAPRLLEISQN